TTFPPVGRAPGAERSQANAPVPDTRAAAADSASTRLSARQPRQRLLLAHRARGGRPHRPAGQRVHSRAAGPRGRRARCPVPADRTLAVAAVALPLRPDGGGP